MNASGPQTDQQANRGQRSSPKPWPLPVERKGPAAIVAVLGLVVLHLLASLPGPGGGPVEGLLLIPRDQLRFAQIGLVAFWMAAGSGTLRARGWGLVPLAGLIWLGAPGGVWELPLFALISFWLAGIAAGVGMLAVPIFRRREDSQFRLRDLLLGLTVYAILLAILQHLLHASDEVAAMTPEIWQMAQVQLSMQGLFMGLCCLPVLAARGGRLWTLAWVLPLLVLLTTGEMSLYHFYFHDEIPWYLFPDEWSFYLMLIFKLKVSVAVILWITLFPADYALNLFHRPVPP